MYVCYYIEGGSNIFILDTAEMAITFNSIHRCLHISHKAVTIIIVCDISVTTNYLYVYVYFQYVIFVCPT